MPAPTNLNELTALFLRLGASDPEGWARSQTQGGLNQLHRFLFLRQAWKQVVTEDDDRWIDKAITSANQDALQPYAGVGLALSRLLASGASRSDIVDLVRGMQAQALFGFCYLLDDPSICDPALDDLGWSLVETSQGEPTNKPIEGLHESVLYTDPTGREMRPRNAT